MTMRILVPVDGSASSRAAVRFLAGRETMLGQNPEIELLTVQNVVPQRLVEMLSLESLESYYRAEGERVFGSLRDEIRAAGFEAKEIVRGGEPGKVIAKEAEGFLYIVSSLGVTGTRSEIKTDLASIVKVVRENTKTPCAIGFGISTPEQATTMAGIADGAIVGSAIIKLLEQYGTDAPEHIGAYVKSMKDAIRA